MNGFMQKASAAGWKKSNRIHHESSQHGYTMNAANQVMQPTNKDYRYARSTTTTPAMLMEAKFLKLRRCGKSGSSHKIRRRGAGIFSMDHIFLRRLRATWGGLHCDFPDDFTGVVWIRNVACYTAGSPIDVLALRLNKQGLL